MQRFAASYTFTEVHILVRKTRILKLEKHKQRPPDKHTIERTRLLVHAPFQFGAISRNLTKQSVWGCLDGCKVGGGTRAIDVQTLLLAYNGPLHCREVRETLVSASGDSSGGERIIDFA